MKKGFILGIIAAMLFVMTGCGSKDINVDELASKLAAEAQFDEQLTEVSDDVTFKRLSIDKSKVEDCAAYSGTKAVADEIVVIKSNDTADIMDAVNAHIKSQKESYSSYRPDEVPKIDDCILIEKDGCVILCVSKDSDSAQRVLDEYLKG